MGGKLLFRATHGLEKPMAAVLLQSIAADVSEHRPVRFTPTEISIPVNLDRGQCLLLTNSSQHGKEKDRGVCGGLWTILLQFNSTIDEQFALAQ
jgi:hypothetical protein